MHIQSVFKHYYQQLYEHLQSIDQGSDDRSSEIKIRMLNHYADQLMAFVNLLAFIDEKIPLLRCQKAIAKLKEDLYALYVNYLEEQLVRENPQLYNEHRDFKKILSREEAINRKAYDESVHQLYLNTIHASSTIIEDHLNQLNEDRIRSDIFHYFRNIIEVYNAVLQKEDFDRMDELLSEIYYNFSLFYSGVAELLEDTEGLEIIQLLQKMCKITEERKLYHNTANKLQIYGYPEDQLDRDLLVQIQAHEQVLLLSLDQLESLGNRILQYLNRILWTDI